MRLALKFCGLARKFVLKDQSHINQQNDNHRGKEIKSSSFSKRGRTKLIYLP